MVEDVARKKTEVLIPQNSLTAGKETKPVAIRAMGKTKIYVRRTIMSIHTRQ